MLDTRLIVVALIAISLIFIAAFIFPMAAKWRLRPLQSIIDGPLSLKFIMDSLSLVPCLKGAWQGRPVEVILKQGGRSSALSISLLTRCSSPCSNIVVRPANIYSDALYTPPCVEMNFFRDAPGFRIPQTNLQVISDADIEEPVRLFLNPARLKIIEDLFSQGFDRFEIRQTESESFISAAAQFRDFRPFKSKRGFFLNPQTVDGVLSKLKEL